jgi:hypothetical protein
MSVVTAKSGLKVVALLDPAELLDVVGLEEQGDNARDILQRVIDNLLFYSDEVEMHRLPVRDPASALRLAARLFALERDLI